MTDLDVMKHAKGYMEKLSRGIDPISGSALPDDAALNNPRLMKCFAYVTDILDKVIANGGRVGQFERTQEFRLTPEQKASVRLSTEPVRITWLVDALWQAAGNPDMKKPAIKRITNWLIEKGFMELGQGADGRPQRLPTRRGAQLGLTVRTAMSRDGEYLAVCYSEQAQRFLLDHLEEILYK